MNSKSKVRLTVALTVLVAIGGCGGGGGGGYNGGAFPVATTAPPPSTPADPGQPVMQAAYDKFLQYLKEVVQTALDTSEPADVTAFDPAPVSDVAEPVALQQ